MCKDHFRYYVYVGRLSFLLTNDARAEMIFLSMKDVASVEYTFCRCIIRGQKSRFYPWRLVHWQKELFVDVHCMAKMDFCPLLFIYLLFFIFVGRNSNTTPNVLVEAPSMNLWSRFLLMHKNIDRAFANVILKICCYSFCIGRDKNSCSDIKSFCTIIFNFCSNLFHKIYTMFH